jgi:hypothetical protein
LDPQRWEKGIGPKFSALSKKHKLKPEDFKGLNKENKAKPFP